MKRRYWTAAEEQLLRERYSDTPTDAIAADLRCKVSRVHTKALKLGLHKSEAYLASPASARRLAGYGPNKGSFQKGHQTWNKGTHYKAGGRSPETRFKTGHRPIQWVPIGTEVTDADGYRKRKIRDDAPPGMSRRNWKFVHVLLWEEHHGPVPPGHNVVFINKDHRDIRIENLELVSNRELMKRNTVHNLPKELVGVIWLKGAIQRQINRRLKA